MVDVLVIPDGAAERPGEEPTSLERADTPVLDGLCTEGVVTSVQTIPAGLSAGSEVGTATLLGARFDAAPGRGWIEAAAAGIPVPDGGRPRRVDLFRDGRRLVAGDPAAVAASLAGASGGPAYPLGGHRYLLLGPDPPELPFACELRVWPDGPQLKAILDADTVLVGASGGAVGCARLLGARAIVPRGATGGRRTDCAAKATAALAELPRARRVVVHVAAPDEAAHERDPEAKVAALEAIDRDLLGPLWQAVRRLGGSLAVCPDHGTDPRTGAHLAAPVPCVRWAPGLAPAGPDRLHERLLQAEVSLA